MWIAEIIITYHTKNWPLISFSIARHASTSVKSGPAPAISNGFDAPQAPVNFETLLDLAPACSKCKYDGGYRLEKENVVRKQAFLFNPAPHCTFHFTGNDSCTFFGDRVSLDIYPYERTPETRTSETRRWSQKAGRSRGHYFLWHWAVAWWDKKDDRVRISFQSPLSDAKSFCTFQLVCQFKQHVQDSSKRLKEGFAESSNITTEGQGSIRDHLSTLLNI